VPKLVPAELKIYRNIGVWRHRRDVRWLVHAPSDDMNIDPQTNERSDSWQKTIAWHQVQGGVVGPGGELGQAPKVNCSHCDPSGKCHVFKKVHVLLK